MRVWVEADHSSKSQNRVELCLSLLRFDEIRAKYDEVCLSLHIRVPAVASKGRDNVLLKRPPVSRNAASQEGLSELSSDPVIRGKNPPTSVPYEGGRQEPGGNNPASPSSDVMASGKKDVCFRRTSSCSDADASEPSFIDMLKSNAKKPAQPEDLSLGGLESSDGTQGGRSAKKKGKKGRQINPALLGFKVTSNRIMMGEIQGIDD